MWMLVRDNAVASETDGSRMLASCPDTDDRGDPWRWSVRSHRTEDGRPEVRVDFDGRHVVCRRRDLVSGDGADLQRDSGDQLVITVLAGHASIRHRNGPWQRSLAGGDVFIVEGETDESLRLDLTAEDSHAVVVDVRPMGNQPLRWVP